MSQETNEKELEVLVERYQVCWEVFPEWSRVGQERKRTGVVVELYGTHYRPSAPPKAGCRHCIPVLEALLKIADFAIRDAGPALASIRAHSGIEYATERGGRPDIVVALTLSAPEEDVRGGLDTSLNQVRERLGGLGASQRTWQVSG
jgi:hypothetical protein